MVGDLIKEEANANTEPEYVIVSPSPGGECMELPVNSDDGSLGLSTLTHAVPGAHGLKYKNPKTGISRALLTDPSGLKFFPPKDGWGDKVFDIIYHADPPKRLYPGDQNAKRKKMMDESVTSDSDGEGNGTHQGTAKLQRLNEESSNEGGNIAQTVPAKRDSAVKAKATESESDSGPCSDLIILGLPYKFAEDDLRKYFESFGTVAMCEIKRNTHGESKGFGFVQMSKLKDQDAVLESPHTIGGRKCQVKVPLSKEVDYRDARGENAKIFVGRLSEKTTQRSLRDFFMNEAKKIDPKAVIMDVFIPQPSRGFGFVTFASSRIVNELLKRDDYVIDEATVSISPAVPKPSTNYNPGGAAPYAFPRKLQYGSLNQLPQPWEGRRSATFNDVYESRFDARSPMPSGSSSLATGLETLNINNMKPDVMDAAWKAFWSIAQNGPELYTPQRGYSNHHNQSSYHTPGGHHRAPHSNSFHRSNGMDPESPAWR